MATTPKPVYALVGSDSLLQLEELGRVLALLPGAQRQDVDGERAELVDVLDDLRCFAMFGPQKVVVVANADAFVTRYREAVESYLGKPAPGSVLVLRLLSLPKNQRVYKLIDKVGEIRPCDPPRDLSKWLMERARTIHKITLLPDAAQLLVDLVGGPMGRLDMELAKLALQTDGSKVDVAAVEQKVSFQREQEMWHMTDELSRGHITEALKRWRLMVQVDPSTEFRAVAWLAVWLQKAEQAVVLSKRGINAFTIGQELKIWPRPAAEAFVKTAVHLGLDGLVRAVDWLVEVDYQSKTGVGNMAENIERYLLLVGNLMA